MQDDILLPFLAIFLHCVQIMYNLTNYGFYSGKLSIFIIFNI